MITLLELKKDDTKITVYFDKDRKKHKYIVHTRLTEETFRLRYSAIRHAYYIQTFDIALSTKDNHAKYTALADEFMKNNK